MKTQNKITVAVFAFIAIALFVGSFFLDSDPPSQLAGWVRNFAVLLGVVDALLFLGLKEETSRAESNPPS